MKNIKYLGFAKESSSAPILGITPQEESVDEIKLEVSKVLQRLKNFELRSEERQKVKSQLGCWYCKKDNRGLLYFALCSPNYPERHIYSAINQIRDHLVKLEDYQTEPDSTLKLHSRQFIENICTQFQTIKGLDKVTGVGNLVNDLTNDMRRNTSQFMDNIVNVQKVGQKSERLRQQSKFFEQTAEEVQQMSAVKCRIRVLIGVSFISLVLLIFIPIVTGTISD